MDIFSKKSSTQDNVTRDSVSNDTSSKPATVQPAQSSANQPVVKKEKHSRAFSFVSILFLLTLLGAGVMTYMWYNQSADIESLNREITQAKAEQETLKNQVSELRKANGAEVVVEAVTETDDDMIKAEVVSYNQAFKDSEDKQFTVAVTKKTGLFAWASYGLVQSESGGKCLLKKVDTNWVVLYCGQNTPPQTDLDSWGVPKDF